MADNKDNQNVELQLNQGKLLREEASLTTEKEQAYLARIAYLEKEAARGFRILKKKLLGFRIWRKKSSF